MKYNTLKKGAAGSMLALTMVTTAVPAPRAEAATLGELQAQIQALIAQIQALKGNVPSTSNLGSCNPFTIDMTLGRSGNEVTQLQKFLINRGHQIPAGATGYFGEQTRLALMKFQVANGIYPSTGYFGPMTRGKVNALCATVPQTSNNGGSTSTKPTPKPDVSLKGEATFDNYDALSGDDTNLEEGQKAVSVMDVRFDVQDGDARINRIDLGFTPDSDNDEKRPWRTFKEVSVYDGSNLIGKIDASNKSNWKENSPTNGSYMLRLSNVNWVVKKGETAEFSVKVTTATNVNGSKNGEVWNIFVPNDGIRALDSYKTSLYIGDSSDFVTVDIDQEGSMDELTVKRSDENPDATTLPLKDDSRSGYIKVFAFDIDTDNSNNDIEITKLPVQLTVSSGTVNTYMRDARLVVDGKVYTKKSITDGATSNIVFEFGQNEFVIPKGERVKIAVEVEFKPLTASNEGVSIYGVVNSSQIKAEGSDSLGGSQLSGVVTGETHTLRTKGIIGEAGLFTSNVTSVDGAINDYATYSTQVKVTAFNQDVYIPVDVDEAISYQLENNLGVAISNKGIAVLTSNAREESGYFLVTEGETKNFTLTVTYKPEVSMTIARLQLLAIAFSDSAVTPNQTWTAAPASSYETNVATIVD